MRVLSAKSLASTAEVPLFCAAQIEKNEWRLRGRAEVSPEVRRLQDQYSPDEDGDQCRRVLEYGEAYGNVSILLIADGTWIAYKLRLGVTVKARHSFQTSDPRYSKTETKVVNA